MGDARHKKPREPGDEEIVTASFRRKARSIMQANRVTNRLHGWKPGDPGYLIEDDVQLAIAVIGNADGKTQIGNILGPVRATTKPRNLIDRTTMLGKIRAALKMSDPVTVQVDPSRAQVVSWISSLTDEEFLVFETAYKSVKKQRF